MHACGRAGVGGGWWSRACIHAGGQASVLVVRGSSLSPSSPSPLPFVCHCRCHCLSSSSLSVFFIVCLLRCHLSAWPHPRQQHGSTAALAGCVASSLLLSVCVVSSLAGWPRHHLSSLSSSVCMASSSSSMWQCSSTGWLGGLVVVVVVVVVVCLLHCCLSAWTRCHLPGWLHGPIVIPWVLSLSSPWVMLLLSLLLPSPWRCHRLCCGHHIAIILWMLCRVWEGEGGWWSWLCACVREGEHG